MPKATFSKAYTYNNKTYGPGVVDAPQEVIDLVREHTQAGSAKTDLSPKRSKGAENKAAENSKAAS